MNLGLKIVYLILALSCITTLSYSQEITAEDFYISGISYSKNQIADKIGIVILNNEKFQDNDELQVNYIFNDNILANSCKHTVVFNDDSSYNKKIYCPIPTQVENGLYTIQTKLIREDKVLKELKEYSFFYDSNKTFSTMKFTQTPKGVNIKLILPENLEDGDIIYHEIPKEVLPLVTPSTKKDVISSNKEYIIIEEDPIIAWEVSAKDTEIEYTLLNNSVEESQKVDFKTYKQDENSISIVVIFSIVVLLIIIFVPFFFKK